MLSSALSRRRGEGCTQSRGHKDRKAAPYNEGADLARPEPIGDTGSRPLEIGMQPAVLLPSKSVAGAPIWADDVRATYLCKVRRRDTAGRSRREMVSVQLGINPGGRSEGVQREVAKEQPEIRRGHGSNIRTTICAKGSDLGGHP